MVIRFARSAFRHGITRDRIRHVVENCPSPQYAEKPAVPGDWVLYLWHDLNGIPLEVGAIETGPDDLLVIHAMRLRRIYEADYLRMLT